MTVELKAVLMIDALQHDWFGNGARVAEEADGSVYIEHDDIASYFDAAALAEAYDELDDEDKQEIYMNFLSNWK